MSRSGRRDVRLAVLGRFALEGALVHDARWGRGRAATLLKLLAVQPDRSLGRDEIAAILWPNATPEHAANNLYKNVHFLRRELERRGAGRDLVQLDATAVRLSAELDIDVATFRHLARAARGSADPELFRYALDAYGGELLPTDTHAPWTVQHRSQVRALWCETLAAGAHASEILGDLDRAIELLALLAREDPAQEIVHARLMRMYIRAGHRDRAIRQYEECREALQRAAGIAPSPETRAIYDEALGAVAIPAPAISMSVLPESVQVGAAPPRRRRTFVGREREMEDLRIALELTLAGQGQARLLAGEAGIGKTFMSVELATHDAQPRGVRILWGSCIEDEGAPAFWPWTQIIRSAIEGGASRAVAALGPAGHALGQIANEAIAPLVAAVPEPPALEPEAARFRLFDTTALFLRNLAEEVPLLIVFDDAHAADLSSLMLLRFLVRELRSARIMVMVTYRDNELWSEHTLSPILAEIARDPAAHRIGLRAMDEDDVRTFIRELSGVEPADAVVAAVYGQTEGHPFFLYQTLRDAIDAGQLSGIGRGESIPVNESVRGLIAARLAPLSAGCRSALEAAAVIGREFRLDVLRLVLGDDALDDVLALMEEASGARVVHEMASEADLFHFAHSLVREMIYRDLPMSRRVALHLRVGEALERMFAADDHLPELAHHFSEALGGPEVALKAVDYGERAAERAADALAFEQAASEYARALRALSRITPPDDGRRCELLLKLGAAQRAAGERDAARASFESAAAIARTLGDGDYFARAALAYEPEGTAMIGAIDPKAVALLREALTLLPEQDGELRARVLALLSRALFWSPPPDQREHYSNEAMAMARRLANPSSLTYALSARHDSLGLERLEERVGISIEIIRTTRDARDGSGEFEGHLSMLTDFLEMGDIGAADHELEAIARLAGELRQPHHLWMNGVRRAMRQILDGRFDDAEYTAREAVTHGLRGHEQNALAFLGVQMLTICTELGRLRELEAPVAGFVEQFPGLVGWHVTLAAVYMEMGQVERARGEFERVAADQFRGLARDPTWMATIIRSGHLAERFGDRRRAAQVYELLSPYAGRCAVVANGLACWGAISHFLGVLAALLGRHSDAVRHFEAALEMNRRMRAAPYLAHTRHEYARFLLDRGDADDALRAHDMLDSALDAAHRMHMVPLLNAASELRERFPRAAR